MSTDHTDSVEELEGVEPSAVEPFDDVDLGPKTPLGAGFFDPWDLADSAVERIARQWARLKEVGVPDEVAAEFIRALAPRAHSYPHSTQVAVMTAGVYVDGEPSPADIDVKTLGQMGRHFGATIFG